MLDTLYKKACGFTVEEETREYAVGDDGSSRLLKQKVQTKYIPPDVTALKAYIELRNNELAEMTDEQIEEEKFRLLKCLEEMTKKRSGE